MAITFTTTVHRNGEIREFKYDGTYIYDCATGERKSGNFNTWDYLKHDLKKQGFKFLPYNPLEVVLTDEEKREFTRIYGYEF